MWPAMFETAVAAFFCAVAVKLMDDYLDRELDAACGRPNLAELIGPGTVIYAAVFLGVATAVNHVVGLALFFASYSVGMFKYPEQTLPSELRGWQESALIIIIGTVLLSWHIMLFSLIFILAVQLWDDCIDYKGDILCGQRNFARRFGTVESFLAGLILLLLAWRLDEKIFWPIFFATLIFYGFITSRQGRNQ